jgi:hypothetical protein
MSRERLPRVAASPRLPHTRGGAPAPQLAGDDDDEEDADDVAEEAVADEHDRANLAGFPQQCCLVWGKLDGVKGAIPADAIEVTHIAPDGATERVGSVDDITFPEPSDGFHAVAQSSLLNSAQLTSLYSTTGTRCHLVMCFEAILKPGTRDIDADGPLFITECEALFDTLTAGTKARLRGRADGLFKHLATGALFPRERLADATVNTVKPSELNEPRSYQPELDPDELRPAVVQVLIRTAQRLLNAETVHRFARTRAEHAADELAEGITTQSFMERVLHHSRRDLWTTEAVEWADGQVESVLERVRGELEAFLRSL